MNFWKNKRVLITGHTGFKGSWLCLWLQQLGAEICGYSLLPPTEPNLFNQINLNNISSITADIGSLSVLKNTLSDFKPEIIIHMAAQSLVRFSYTNPLETYATNVMGTVNLFETARSVSSVRVILNVTTDKCYENKEINRGYHENDSLGGHDPYSNSKACSELITEAYRECYFKNNGIGIASVRAGNVIGGGDWAVDRLLPDLVRSAISKQPLTIRYPNAIRPWQHVLEPLSGYLLLVEKLYENPLEFAGAWNFGSAPEDAKPVQWIADYFSASWPDATWRLHDGHHEHESQTLMLDCTKAREKLAWQPNLSLEESLDQTIDWYKAYATGQHMRQISLTQINNYMNLVVSFCD